MQLAVEFSIRSMLYLHWLIFVLTVWILGVRSPLVVMDPDTGYAYLQIFILKPKTFKT